MIHVALVSAYPTEAEARAAFEGSTLGAYRGTWVHPTPERPIVHVFTDRTDEELEASGYTRHDGDAEVCR